jgi:hypothetical protein
MTAAETPRRSALVRRRMRETATTKATARAEPMRPERLPDERTQ